MFKRLMTCVAVVALITPAAAQQARPARDAFYWLNEMNKAATVMVVETKIVPRPLGKAIAESVAKVNTRAEADRKLRSGDYLAVEPLLIEEGGPDVTRLHSGRSRQEIGAVSRRLNQREQVLATMASVEKARGALIQFAAKHPNALVPAYTHGVQAQPISFGHWLLAFSEALERDSQRLKAAFSNVNQSPLGTGALGTSSFPVDRNRLSGLMGFEGVLINSFGATQVAPIDTGIELASIATSIAATISTFTADVQAQYRMTTPWLILQEGELTGTSSIMPQKRNPNAMTALRVITGQTIGDAVTYFIKAHNTPAGMSDYKGDDAEQALRSAASASNQLAAFIGELRFDEARALDEVNADYSVTTELADILQRDADVPFRVGHHFASELVTFGRGAGLRPSEIQYADAQRIFEVAAKDFKMAKTALPLTEARFRESLSAENMVNSSKGLGGPQPAEVARMLKEQQAKLQQDAKWTQDKGAQLDASAKALNDAFEKIRTGG